MATTITELKPLIGEDGYIYRSPHETDCSNNKKTEDELTDNPKKPDKDN